MPINDDLTITYNIPKEYKEIITNELLLKFKNELHTTFANRLIENPTYYNWYSYFTETCGFCEAFYYACRLLQKEDLLNYYEKLSCYDNDLFDDQLMLLMVEKGIIKLGEPEEVENEI